MRTSALLAALAEVTGTDPSVASVRRTLTRTAAQLAAAEPPYTPDEAREFGRRFHELCPYAARNGQTRPTAREVAKNIGALRAAKLALAGGGSKPADFGNCKPMSFRGGKP